MSATLDSRVTSFFPAWGRVLWTIRRRRAGRPWILGGIAVAAAFSFFLGVTVGLGGAGRDPHGAAAISATIAAALLGLLTISLLRDLATALGYLFVSADAAYLLAAPVHARAVVLGRILEALVDALPFVAVLVLPTLWGAGAAAGAPIYYFPAALVACAALVMISVGASFALAIGLAPLLPARRVRASLRAIAALLYLGIWAAVLWATSGGEAGNGGARRGAEGLAVLAPPALPSTWAAAALEGIRGGRLDVARWGALLACAAAIICAPLVLAGRYPLAWQSARPGAGRSPRRPPVRARSAEPRGAVARPQRGGTFGGLVKAFLRRDARRLTRDSAQVSQLVTQAVFAAALAFVFGARTPDGMRRAALAAATIFAIQLGFELGSRSLPRERGAIALLLSAPLAASRHVVARGAALALPMWLAVIPVAATALSAAGVSDTAWLPTILLIAAAGTTSVAGGLAIGAWHGNPAWRSPAEMLDRTGQYLSVVVFALVVVLAGVSGSLGGAPEREISPARTLAACAVAVLATSLLTWTSRRGLDRFQVLNTREGLGEES